MQDAQLMRTPLLALAVMSLSIPALAQGVKAPSLAAAAIAEASLAQPVMADGSDAGAALLKIAGGEYARLEQRANLFTGSGQNCVSLGQDGAGNTVLVWHSRRQEEGTYGVYARRFNRAGEPISGEVHINHETRNMQMLPALTVDSEGGTWFAWRSFGQDGDQGSIVARRFDRDLGSATFEVVVNDHVQLNQSEVTLAPLADGAVLVVWTTELAGDRTSVRARRMGADGKPAGPEIIVGQDVGALDKLACAASDAQGRPLVVWARNSAAGNPAGIFARRFDAQGAPIGDELRIDESAGKPGIEPALAVAANGDATIGWMENEGAGYGVRLRKLSRAQDSFAKGPVSQVKITGTGYTSGLALDLDSAGNCLVAWNRFGDNEVQDPGLFALLLDAEGLQVGAPFRVTEKSAGRQSITPIAGTRRVHLADDGRMSFAWTGDADLGDSSGAHLTLLAPKDLQLASAPNIQSNVELSFEELSATPHDPPTYNPNQRSITPEDINAPFGPGGDLDFLAISSTGWTPPDPHLAVGPNHVIAITNGEIAFFDKGGTNLFRDEIEDSFGFWGGQGATNFVFDPEVAYDTHSGRYIAFACERGGGQGWYLLAVSDDSNPVGTWHKYRINATPYIGDTDIDSPNLAFDDEAIYMSSDFFGPDKFNVLMIDKTSVLGGGAPVITSINVTGDQSMGFPHVYDTGAPAFYMVGYRTGTANTLRLYAITDPLGTPSIQNQLISVPSYSHPEDPPQAGTSSRVETFEARMWSAVYRDGQLWCTHHVNSGRVRQRWYQFDMQGWPVSGSNPVLVQSGEIDLGGTMRSFFGSLWVDAIGNMAMTYATGSPTQRYAMERTWRAAGDPAGTTRPSTLVRGSTTSETSGRWGDYSQTMQDPVDPNVFWAIHEYREGGWRTRIVRWSIEDCSTSNYCLTAPNSIGPGMVMASSGSTSVAANDLTLYANSGPAGQNGLFYYGPNQAQIAFGNGWRCVTGGIFRLPVTSIDGFTQATQVIDYGSLSAAGAILPGSTWNFQFWYRDPAAGGQFFNLTDGLSATFCN